MRFVVGEIKLLTVNIDAFCGSPIHAQIVNDRCVDTG